MDEESAGGMVIPPGGELRAHGQEIHRRNGISPGITSSLTLIQNGQIKMRGKSFEQ
jgi:hypothetical protein